jgi:DNA-binding NarL/FixJ family response regulator
VEDARSKGRSAYERGAWGDAYEALSRASTEGLLEADDVERLALAAALAGHEDACIDAFERLHQLRLDAGDVRLAVRAAFWASMRLFSLGEAARGGGWLARAQRLLAGEGPDCVEGGYLQLPMVFRFTAAGDYAAARAAAAEAATIGTRHGDRDLSALARLFEGRASIREGRVAEGLSLLDEAMIAVTSAEVSPVVSGLIYCGVIASCQQSYALDRAREWTAALTGWCRAQPQLVAFAGACLIHRSEISQLGGAWSEAFAHAREATTRLSGQRDSEAGNALYQEAELHRLRGALAEAERLYTLARERGRDPQPGLAQLRLAQGRVEDAAAATRRVLSVARSRLARIGVLPAHVEIMLAASELGEARQASDELCAIADHFGMEALRAIARHSAGMVLLAEGDARGAVEALQLALAMWQRIGAPYQRARVRVALARAYHLLGDEDGAALEREAARKVFAELGAAPDVAAIDSRVAPTPSASPAPDSHGLSARELEVLRLVASGKTNKVIARELFVSEKTIDRHVSNIFTKVDVNTRAAATAWAFKKGLAG